LIRLQLEIATLVLVAALGGCEKERAGQGLALKEALKRAEEAGKLPALTPETVDTRDELMAVLRRPYALTAPKLGGLKQDLTTKFEVDAGDEKQITLDEKLVLRIDEKGQYALRHENAWWSIEDHDGEGGRGCWWVGGKFYTARRYGPATEVPIRAYEQERCLESGVEPFVGLVRVLGKYVAPEPQGPVDVGARKALRIKLTRAPDDGEAAPPAEVPLAWPEGDAGPKESKAIFGPRPPLVDQYTRPKALEGELLLDVETGAVLAGKLDGTLTLRKAGREATVVFHAQLDASALDGPVTAPEDAHPYEPRQRVFEDRRALLGEVFKKKGEKDKAQLPKPGDAPPLHLGATEDDPGGDEAAPESGAAPASAPAPASGGVP
jgi:hypothetical protein